VSETPAIPTPNDYAISLFEDSSGGWRWRIVEPQNGRIIATSGEAFASKGNADKARRRIQAANLVHIDRDETA
jgi:uncharacterized protein YegP (UPF0339 family)